MATNIGTNPAFTTANMKPASGEQIDALWGQNIADNTGYCYEREITVPLYSQVTVTNIFYFRKQASHNAIRIAARGKDGTTGAIESYVRFFADGTTTSDGNENLTGTKSYTMAANITSKYDVDISSLTNGSHYYLKYTSSNVSMTPNAIACWQIYGSGATY